MNNRIINSFCLAFNRNRNFFGIVKFPLPDLGEKIKEGKVKKLYVREGSEVKSFQKIADVESDKQFTEITAPAEGTILKILYKED
jgi:pyruvate/2-oxoglutarate dehydrogenase complex dihydrolipoamide acyltransferase (E2) component